MTGLIAEFVLYAVIIMLAGAFLARYADQLGHITKLGRTMAGLVLLAIATSLPELVVGCKAVTLKPPNPDLTVGSLLGSSLMNLLILAVIDLMSQSRGRMLSRAAAAHALSATTSILLTAIAVLFIYLKVKTMFLGLGLGSIAIAVGYVFCLRLIYFDQQFALDHAPEEVKEQKVSPVLAVVGYLLSAGVIFFVAQELAVVADRLAKQTGQDGTFVGTTFVALVTSLPEAVTTFTAMRMGAVDMAIGNVLGSNAFNMLIMLGVDAFYDGNLLTDVSLIHIVTGVSVIVVTSVAIMGMLYRAEKKLWVFEPDAVLMILLILSALTMVYFQTREVVSP